MRPELDCEPDGWSYLGHETVLQGAMCPKPEIVDAISKQDSTKPEVTGNSTTSPHIYQTFNSKSTVGDEAVTLRLTVLWRDTCRGSTGQCGAIKQ